MSGKIVLRLRGIAPWKPNRRTLFALPHQAGFVFEPQVFSGPKSIQGRDVEVRLSREDVAQILGEIPASEMAEDPAVVDAYVILTRFLRGGS